MFLPGSFLWPHIGVYFEWVPTSFFEAFGTMALSHHCIGIFFPALCTNVMRGKPFSAFAHIFPVICPSIFNVCIRHMPHPICYQPPPLGLT
nr:MAG TPA: hypothetical protein [Caudoviricetes sp.]